MPDTTVQKMIGAITILIILMKPSPIALIQSLVAKPGHSQPTMAPRTMAISTCTYRILYHGLAGIAGAASAIAAAMTLLPSSANQPLTFVTWRSVADSQELSQARSQWCERLFQTVME